MMIMCSRWTVLQSTAVLTLLVVTQITTAVSQDCGSAIERTCCQSQSSCPSGSYEDTSCDIYFTTTVSSSTSTTATTTTEEPDDPGDADNTTTGVETTDTTVTPDVDNTTDSGSNITDTSTLSPTTTATTTTTTTSKLVRCRRCPNNCMNCSSTTCLSCEEGFSEKAGKCVPKPKPSTKELPIAAIAGGVAGGVVLIVIIIVAVVCCRRRRPKQYSTEAMDQALQVRAESREPEEVPTPNTPSPGNATYINLGYKPDDLSKQIPRKQDDILRYTRDPTTSKKIVTEVNGEEPIYSNQSTIDFQNEIDALPEAPPPPPTAQGINKKRKTTYKETDEQQTTESEPEEIYENDPRLQEQRVEPEGSENQEVYYNEPEPESPYVNYSNLKK